MPGMIAAALPVNFHRPVSAPARVIPDRAALIKKVALQALAELAISLGIGIAICAFFATSLQLYLVVGVALIQSIANLFVRSVGLYASEKAREGGAHYQRIADVCSILAPAYFAVGTAVNASTLIHEAGHAIAARTVYRNARPHIKIFPYAGGVTRFYPETLSRLGRRLGETRSLALVTAAGPLLSLSVSLIALASSLLVKKKTPIISRYLQVSAASDILNHATYALSALWTPKTKLSHDFVRLASLGLHPLAATAAILASPILVILAVTAIQRPQERFIFA